MLTRATILEPLSRLSDHLKEKGIVEEISLLRGTAMVLAFQARQATKDVDAIFAPASIMREAARAVAAEMGLPEDWLNDAAKAFSSHRADFRVLAGLEFSHLRVQAPIPEYLLAMKVMAARVELAGERGDKEDIAFLIRLLGLNSAEQVLSIVQQYYDPSRILPRSVYLVDEIFEEGILGKEESKL